MAVVLIDGNSLVYRAYFAMIRNPLRNSRGENTSAVYGFVSSLRKLLERLQPEYVAVVFDAPGKTFRHDQYQEYKLQRPPTPPELIHQLPYVKQLVTAWGLSLFEEPEVEADDVLGTLARRFSDQGHQVYLVTTDKDLLQLVSNQILTYDPFKEIIYDPEQVRHRYGVGPEQIADLLALSGDAIDNIPGVPGIGEKRAQQLLLKHGTLEAALAREARLQPHSEIARASKALTLIRTDIPLSVTLEDLKPKPPDRGKLLKILQELEFTSLIQELALAQPTTIPVTIVGHSIEILSAPVIGIALDGDDCYLAAGEKVMKLAAPDHPAVASLLASPQALKVGYDLKPVVKYFQTKGISIHPLADVMIAAWLLDSNRKRYDLPGLMLTFCGQVVAIDQPAQLPVLALKVYEQILPALQQYQLIPLFTDLEMPLIPVLAAMEQRGVMIDCQLLHELAAQLRQEAETCETRIYQQVGVTFNLKSPQQLSQVLFERLKLKPKRRTKTGYSTDASVLQELAADNPLVADILRVRELHKLISTYLEPLTQLCDSRTGRIRTSFNQTGTATGRLSTREPNLQNVPIRSELGRKVRAAFVAAPGYQLISADYAQIELRVLAELSGDGRLKAAFAQGRDIHTQTASALLGCSEQEVTPEARRLAKMVNYGLMYGMSDYGLADRLGIDRDTSRAFMNDYFSLYPGVARWCEMIVNQARTDGFVRTRFGRIRHLPDLRSSNRQAAEAARRAAINTPVQGTAADVIKRAMIAAHQNLTQAGFQGGMTLQIHDELLFEIEQNRTEEAVRIIREAMQNAWQLDIPLQVDIGIGDNWAAIH